MKKLQLSLSRLTNAEVLSRKELKEVLGGSGSEPQGSNCQPDHTYCMFYYNCCNGLSCQKVDGMSYEMCLP